MLIWIQIKGSHAYPYLIPYYFVTPSFFWNLWLFTHVPQQQFLKLQPKYIIDMMYCHREEGYIVQGRWFRFVFRFQI